MNLLLSLARRAVHELPVAQATGLKLNLRC